MRQIRTCQQRLHTPHAHRHTFIAMLHYVTMCTSGAAQYRDLRANDDDIQAYQSSVRMLHQCTTLERFRNLRSAKHIGRRVAGGSKCQHVILADMPQDAVPQVGWQPAEEPMPHAHQLSLLHDSFLLSSPHSVRQARHRSGDNESSDGPYYDGEGSSASRKTDPGACSTRRAIRGNTVRDVSSCWF